MAYTKTTWVNGTAPAINATNLNKIETGIEDAHNGTILFPLGSATTPSITFTGDIDTGFYRPASNQIAIVNGGVENLRINGAGKTLIGTDTSFTTRRGSGSVGARLQTIAVDDSASVLVARFSADNESPRLFFAKSRNATIGSHTSVNSGDVLGEISFGGSDGTAIGEGARISALVDTTPGSNDMPGRLAFFTSADGTTSVTERMRVNSTGELLIGYTATNTTATSYKLQVNSQIFATSGTIATSDGKYKQDIVTIQNGLDIVKKLNPVEFNWKKHEVHNFDLTTKTVGFIAQEVEKALENTSFKNAIIKYNQTIKYDENGNEIIEPFLGIAEGNLIAILTSAIQQLNAKIEQLETKLGG